MINREKRNRKRLKKLRERHKSTQKKLAILRVMRNHNEVKYREIPGTPGRWPYQLTPITFDEARILYETGSLPERKGVTRYMTDAQKQRLADLQATESLAVEEKPVLDALVALQTADQALADARAATQNDPVAVATQAVNDAQVAYEQAEATFKATQPDPSANAGQAAATDPSAGQDTAGATPTDPNAPADPASGTGSEGQPAA